MCFDETDPTVCVNRPTNTVDNALVTDKAISEDFTVSLHRALRYT